MGIGRAALIGLALLGAYLLGASNAPSPQPQAEPVALVAPQPPQPSESTTQDRLGMAQPNAPPAQKPSASLPLPAPGNAARTSPVQVEPKAKPTEPPEIKKPKVNTKGVLTAAAIAALIVTASRNSYYATGRPCACPDDRMRNGRRCGSRSAYSRPGGASPLCFPRDVTSEMIAEYRKRASR
jgi:hypothetical protein